MMKTFLQSVSDFTTKCRATYLPAVGRAVKPTLAKVARYVPIYRELLDCRDALWRISAETRGMRALEAIRAFDADMAANPRYAEPLRLVRHGFQVNSQHGEDGIVHEIFRRIGTSDRTFVEIGVGDGNENNTAFLLSQGWKGFWIDGSDAFVNTLAGRDDLRGCVTSRVAMIDRENVAGIFSQMGVPKEFDLLSLDVDQNTYYVWQGLKAFSPRVVVIEYNATLPADVDWKVQYDAQRVWDGSQSQGASLKALERLGEELGYCLVGCEYNGANAFFVRSDLVAEKFASPFTSENHCEPPRYIFAHRRAGHTRTILERS